MGIRTQENRDRDRRIFLARVSGRTLKSVGRRFGITGNRVRQIMQRELRSLLGSECRCHQAENACAEMATELRTLHSQFKLVESRLRTVDTEAYPPPTERTPIRIDDLELSVRSYNCFKNSGIETLNDLVSRSPRDLLRIKNFGRISLSEIQQVLGQYGLALSGENAAVQELARCDREIEQAKLELRAGNPDVEGLTMALSDWSEEKRLIEEEVRP